MERLKQLREAKRMTQVRLGMEIGVSQETISGYEISKAVPPADILVKLANCLNTSVDYLLCRTDVKEYNTLNKSDLTDAEIKAFTLIRALPTDKREKVFGFIEGLSE